MGTCELLCNRTLDPAAAVEKTKIGRGKSPIGSRSLNTTERRTCEVRGIVWRDKPRTIHGQIRAEPAMHSWEK
jgi:hypothetical protein